MLGELADDRRQAELLERRDLALHAPQHEADRAALAHHVDAEAAEARRPSTRSRPRSIAMNSSARCFGMIANAMRSVSTGDTGSWSVRSRRPSTRMNGGEPTLMWTSDAPRSTAYAQQLVEIQHGATPPSGDGLLHRHAGARIGRRARLERNRGPSGRSRVRPGIAARSRTARDDRAARAAARSPAPAGSRPADQRRRRSPRPSRGARRGRSRPRGTRRAGPGGRQRHAPGR